MVFLKGFEITCSLNVVQGLYISGQHFAAVEAEQHQKMKRRRIWNSSVHLEKDLPLEVVTRFRRKKVTLANEDDDKDDEGTEKKLQ